MTVFGIGTQIVDCARVAQLIERHGERFLLKVFTVKEIDYGISTSGRTETYAAMWAGKQGVFRALGGSWRKNTAWHELELTYSDHCEPEVSASGETLQKLLAIGNASILLTTAHTRTYATATAIIVAN